MPKQKQQEKSRETLEIYAPLAHRLGITRSSASSRTSPSRPAPAQVKEIKGLVNQQREEREGYVSRAGEYSRRSSRVGIKAQVSGRAKHFYSIYRR